MPPMMTVFCSARRRLPPTSLFASFSGTSSERPNQTDGDPTGTRVRGREAGARSSTDLRRVDEQKPRKVIGDRLPRSSPNERKAHVVVLLAYPDSATLGL